MTHTGKSKSCSICGQWVKPDGKSVEGKMKRGGIVRIHLRCWVEEQKERRKEK